MKHLVVCAPLLLAASCASPPPEPVGVGEGEGEGDDDGTALVDPDGDVPFGFIDIVRAGFATVDADVSLWMEVLSLPALDFQRADVAVGTLEYGWNILLDADGDGENELLVSATAYNSGDPLVTGPMHENVDAALYETDGGALTTIGRVEITSDDERITFTLPRDIHPAFAQLSDGVPLLVTTAFNNADGLHGDEAER